MKGLKRCQIFATVDGTPLYSFWAKLCMHKIVKFKYIQVWRWPISTRVYFKVRFFVLTLKPYSTVSFNTIFFKLTCTKSPVSQVSGEKTTVLSSLDNFWHIFKSKKSIKGFSLLKHCLKNSSFTYNSQTSWDISKILTGLNLSDSKL